MAHASCLNPDAGCPRHACLPYATILVNIAGLEGEVPDCRTHFSVFGNLPDSNIGVRSGRPNERGSDMQTRRKMFGSLPREEPMETRLRVFGSLPNIADEQAIWGQDGNLNQVAHALSLSEPLRHLPLQKFLPKDTFAQSQENEWEGVAAPGSLVDVPGSGSHREVCIQDLPLEETWSSGVVGSKMCTICNNRTSMVCSACEAAYYCSAACQQRDWPAHRKACGKSRLRSSEAFTPKSTTLSQTRAHRQPHTAFTGSRSITLAMETRGAGEVRVMASLVAQGRRTQLRALAMMAFREHRYKDALTHAAEALKVTERLSDGIRQDALDPEEESATLADLVIAARAAYVLGKVEQGSSSLDKLLAAADRIVGRNGQRPLFDTCSCATLLFSVAELCDAYEHSDKAREYAAAFLNMVRVAHGEGSPAVGDALAFMTAVLVKQRRYGEARLHAEAALLVRQRNLGTGAHRPLADAHWNVSVVYYELGRHTQVLEHLQAARELHWRLDGDGVETAAADVAIGTVFKKLGNVVEAMQAFRRALRARQHRLGLTHPVTRSAAGLVAAVELQQQSEELKAEVATQGTSSPLPDVMDVDFCSGDAAMKSDEESDDTTIRLMPDDDFLAAQYAAEETQRFEEQRPDVDVGFNQRRRGPLPKNSGAGAKYHAAPAAAPRRPSWISNGIGSSSHAQPPALAS